MHLCGYDLYEVNKERLALHFSSDINISAVRIKFLNLSKTASLNCFTLRTMCQHAHSQHKPRYTANHDLLSKKLILCNFEGRMSLRVSSCHSF